MGNATLKNFFCTSNIFDHSHKYKLQKS